MNSLLLEVVKEQLAKEKNAEEETKKFHKQFSFLDFNPIFLTLWLSSTTIQREKRMKQLEEIIQRMEKGYETLPNQNEQLSVLTSS